eukprot:SAG22_NODE_1426_length_4457_cov_8.244149_3_plen_337_part_00
MEALFAVVAIAAAAAGAQATGGSSCPPACPDVSFSEGLRKAAQQSIGIQIALPDEALIARQQTRPADDRHFYKQQAVAQLARYRQAGIGQADVAAAMGVSRATKYQLSLADGKIYRSRDCMFSARCQGVEHFLAAALPAIRRRKFKNAKGVIELAMNVRDWPQEVDRKAGLPLFSFSKRIGDEAADIMYPAWAFWEGGPWLAVIKTWQWPKMRADLTAAAEAHPWAAKSDQVFFRGSRTSGARDPFVRKGVGTQTVGAKWNVRYVKNQSQKSNEHVTNVLKMEFAEAVPMADHCRYKYLLNFDGQVRLLTADANAVHLAGLLHESLRGPFSLPFRV